MEKPGDDVSAVHVVVVFLDPPLINGLGRSEIDGNTLNSDGFLILERIHSLDCLLELATHIDEVQFLGICKQLIPEIGDVRC